MFRSSDPQHGEPTQARAESPDVGPGKQPLVEQPAVHDRKVPVQPKTEPAAGPPTAESPAQPTPANHAAAPTPHDVPGPAGGARPAAPAAPAPAAGGPGASIASTFAATREALTPPPFGEVDWDAHEPTATYAAYREGDHWRFRLESLSLSVPVGISGGGTINVPSAADAVVTAATWRKIASDLTPGGGSPNRPPRDRYWAEDLTWKHELFHFAEFNTFLRVSFGSFETTIEGAGYTERATPADTAAAALGRKTADLRARLLAAWNQAKTNMAPGMEARAYDDGTAAYQARADGVRTRARAEGWA